MGSQTKRLQYQYDSRGNRSALIDHDGGRFTYTYDAVNRITQVQNPQGDRTSYSYDDAGRRTLKKMSNGTRASFTYDAAGNLTKLYNLKSDGTVISSFDYQYDKVGNRTAVLEAGGSRVTWSYDATYQLTGEHRTGSNAYRDTYTYDSTGNRLLKIHDGARTTSAYDAANQLRYTEDVSGRTTYTFDADGNQQRILAPNGDRTTYVWDYENRMTSVRLPSGIRNTMAYEPEGLRVKLEESSGTKKFVWDDQNYLAETDSAHDTQVVYTNEPRVYGNLVSQRRLTDGVWTPHWYHFDAIGSTRELTTSGQAVSDTRLYDAWGVIAATTGTTVFPFHYVGSVGYHLDVNTLLEYVRSRIYRAHIGYWMSVDPLLRHFNLRHYTYVRNRPAAVIDPSGLQEADKWEQCGKNEQRIEKDLKITAFHNWPGKAYWQCKVVRCYTCEDGFLTVTFEYQRCHYYSPNFILTLGPPLRVPTGVGILLLEFNDSVTKSPVSRLILGPCPKGQTGVTYREIVKLNWEQEIGAGIPIGPADIGTPGWRRTIGTNEVDIEIDCCIPASC